VREWIVKFGEITQQRVSAPLVAIWIEQLADISPDVLAHAFDRLAKTWAWPRLPTPGDVRAAIDNAEGLRFELKAEDAWHSALDYCSRHYHPDFGVDRQAPELSGAMAHAIRAAGGARRLFNCSTDDLVWAKKMFVEDFTQLHQLHLDEHLLSDGEARGILERLQAPPKLLTMTKTPPQAPIETVPDESKPTDFDTVGRKIRAVKTSEPMSAEQVEERRRVLLKQKEEILLKYGGTTAPSRKHLSGIWTPKTRLRAVR